MAKLLVIDDEPNIVFSMRECLAGPELEVLSAGSAREGISLVRSARPDVVILDVRLPDMTGLEAFQQISEIDSRLPVILFTAYSSTETAIEAMRRGAFDYLIKPVDFEQLQRVVGAATEVSRLSRVPATISQPGAGTDSSETDRILGQSPPMQAVYKAIGRIAPVDAPVLILGESGSGKELVARAIYHYSRRSQKPFLAINCAALPEALLESELFGHEAGAFTGAHQRRIGKFEQVNGGTIFLDEIGDMNLATQAKALRLLQEQSFQRVGGNQSVQTDVRIIAATNQNLEEKIAAGEFRLDLFYRLNVFTIHLPPLRERRSDIPLLIEHFIRRYENEHSPRQRRFSAEALAVCEHYSWPGNVRELESAVRYALVHATGDVIPPEMLPDAVLRQSANGRESLAATKDWRDLRQLVQQLLREGSEDIYHRVQHAVDAVVLEEVLNAVEGNQAHACRRLGIARMTLRSKLRQLRLPGASETVSETD